MAKTFLPQFKTFRTKCIEAFGKCRKYEDKVGEAVQNCGKKPTKVIQDLANAQKTSAAVDKVQAKVKTLQGTRRRVQREAASYTCKDFADKAKDFTMAVNTNPKAPETAQTGKTLAAATVATCTDDDKKSLTKIAFILERAKEGLALLIEVMQTTVLRK